MRPKGVQLRNPAKAPPTFGHGDVCPTVEIETGAVRQQLQRLAVSIQHAEREMDMLKSALDSAVRQQLPQAADQCGEPLPPECELAILVRTAANRVDRLTCEIAGLRELLDL